jgi:hypothetical protein
VDYSRLKETRVLRHLQGPAARVAALTALAALTAAAGLTPASAAGTTEYTLTVQATNLSGQPDIGGDMQVWSVDDTTLQSAAKFTGGVATFHLPAGHYFAVALFGGSGLSKPPPRHVLIPQINLTGNQTLSVAEAEASSKVTMTTPRPATALDTDVELLRTGVRGPAIEIEFLSSGPEWFNPVNAKPTVETFRVAAIQHLESPAGSGVPYEYTLSYLDPPGIVPPQHYAASAKDLATVHERFYQPVQTTGSWAFPGTLPGTSPNKNKDWFGFVEPEGPAVTLPGQLTEYVGGPATMEWNGEYALSSQTPFVVSDPRLLHPGESLTENWSAFPLHTAANVLLTSRPNMFGATLPSASRRANTLTLAVDPFDDNQPGHVIGWLGSSSAAKVAGSYEVDQNGTKIASGNAVSKFPGPDGEFYTKATLNSAKASTIRFALNVTRTGAVYPLSTAISTVWTWRTTPAGLAKVPAGWTCVLYHRVSNCAVQPMLTLRYAVAGLSLHGAAPAGRQVLHLSVGHLQAAAASAIAHAAVSVSFDGGQTWHRAQVSGSGGHYTATFTAPAGTKVTLRTSAGDAAGGSITETITNAYQIG